MLLASNLVMCPLFSARCANHLTWWCSASHLLLLSNCYQRFALWLLPVTCLVLIHGLPWPLLYHPPPLPPTCSVSSFPAIVSAPSTPYRFFPQPINLPALSFISFLSRCLLHWSINALTSPLTCWLNHYILTNTSLMWPKSASQQNDQ